MILLDLSQNSGKNEVLLVKIGAMVQDLWLDTSFGPLVAQMQFLGPKPQGREIFGDLMILLDLSYNAGENEVPFVKIEARVPDLRLNTSSGPK